MTTTYVKHPVTGGAAEVARLVLTDKNGTPKEVSALWKDGVCLFAKKGALVKNGNEMEDIDGNDVMAWSLPSDTPIPRHTYPWESEIIPLHDEDRWYVIVPNSVVVTMGGVNITDTCYDAETHKISIPMVKGDIVVEAEATEVIQFEDSIAKNICVTNWGGNYVDDEITAKEAAAVTNIAPTGENAYFMGAQMKKFNEFRYFTGLETISTSTTTLANAMGTFQGCNLLEEITLPKLSPNVTIRCAVFNGCSSLTHVDLTPWGTTANDNNVNISFMFYNTGLEELDLSPFSKIVLWLSAFTNSAITKLTTRGIAFSPQGTPPDAFAGCSRLTTIDGGITGYRYQLDFKSCRGLTHDSAVEIINTVGSGVGSVRPLIFYATTYDTLTDEEKAVATSKNRSVLRSIL